ncbi:MAG: nitronate monooxygenase [Chlorobi bacterium]|nr:nitronate monooxygenase [Chlorobiota bacterium]
MKKNRICQLFGIKYPIIQGGMIWCSGWELASAVSNAGGLGLIGSGSMTPEVLQLHIQKAKKATNNPFGVNVPLIYSRIEETMEVIVKEKVKIVFTSAGNPKTWTDYLHKQGIKVVHVVANLKFALKSREAGVDAVVAEGFEAGGHNGREETTTMVLIPLIRDKIDIPLIAAGGISSGRSMLASIILGADGVQIGSRFAACAESSSHRNFKKKITELGDGDTQLALRKLIPVRLIKNNFFEHIASRESAGASVTELVGILGKGRAKKGMFEGDVVEGELEIGQVSANINEILTAKEIIDSIIKEYSETLNRLSELQ